MQNIGIALAAAGYAATRLKFTLGSVQHNYGSPRWMRVAKLCMLGYERSAAKCAKRAYVVAYNGG